MNPCTVIITCFNDGAFIKEAIKSVENSSLKSDVIIVDDCSTDEKTVAIINELASNYKVLRIPKNSGVGNARNTAIKAANTKYVLPLDADDILTEDFVENAVSFLEQNHDCVMVYGDVQKFGAEEKLVIPPAFNGPMLLAGNYINNSSLFRKEAWEKTAGYDVTLPNYEDWDMWIQLYEQGGVFKKLDQVAIKYRVKKVSKIGKTKDPLHREKVVKIISEKHAEIYQRNVSTIIGYLHRVITTNEQQLDLLAEDAEVAGMANKIVRLEQQLKDQKAYYEGSFFWKLKQLLQFKK